MKGHDPNYIVSGYVKILSENFFPETNSLAGLSVTKKKIVKEWQCNNDNVVEHRFRFSLIMWQNKLECFGP